MKDLYVLAYIDSEGNVSHYPLGDKPLIKTLPKVRTYFNIEAARRDKKFFTNAVIVKVKEYEVIE